MPPDYIANRVRNPGKRYTIGGLQERYLTLHDAIINLMKAPFVCCEKTWHVMRTGFLLLGDIHVQ